MGTADFEIRSGWLTFSAATAVGVFAGALLSAVVPLFQSRDTPAEQRLVAERACAHYHYRAERETCIAQWLARSRAYIPLKR